MRFHYVWLIWSSAFMFPWIALYALYPLHRVAMWRSSAFMALFGLTEPLFVPGYWNPPSLFELARETGFDIESFIFSFAIGGIAAVLYNALWGKKRAPVSDHDRQNSRHRVHLVALLTTFVAFPILYVLPWNVIYAGITAMLAGTIAGLLCRPDLLRGTWVGGALFLGLYTLFLLGLKWSAPGYIEEVWNLRALSGVVLYGLPLEELLFALTFGMYWAGLYEHFGWLRVTGGNHPASAQE